jgi:hypothetical protein
MNCTEINSQNRKITTQSSTKFLLFSVQSKDIVILEYDLALGLTSKVVHEYFRNALVTFATGCISPTEVMLSFVHYPEFVFLIEHQFFIISPFKLMNQMANPVLMVVDKEGHAHSACLHWEGFPSILWGVLSTAGYPNPPLYVG